jgi:hypothetical protein
MLYSSQIPANNKVEVCDEPDYFQQTITPITNSKLYVPPEILSVPVNLTTVIYRQSELHSEIPEYHATENNSLEYVDLSLVVI